ncbi:putative CENPB DNA-binding domain-containing protein 1 [Pangshura tecta]
MSQKYPTCDSGVPSSSSTSSSKKTRKTISLVTKLDILRHFDAGEHEVDIGITLGLTMRLFWSNTDKIRASPQCVTLLSATTISQSRSSLLENMEHLLSWWMEDQNQQNIPLSLLVIRAKAKSLYDNLKRDQGEDHRQRLSQQVGNGLISSGGTSTCITSRCLVRQLVLILQQLKNSDYLKKIIEEGDYPPKQVFNVDETGLYWKRMPEQTYIS